MGVVIEFSFGSEKPVVLPKFYNQVVQGFFYRNIDRLLSEFLHGVGFVYGGRRFKLFTFSKLFGEHAKDHKGNIVFQTPITVNFASPYLKLMESLLERTISKDALWLGNNRVFLSQISSTEYKVFQPCTVKCLSPITVYRTPEGSKRFHYLSPFEEEFYELLRSNLLKKYVLVYGKQYRGALSIEPVKVKKNYRRKILFKGTLIEAWEGIYNIVAEEDMIKVALYAGLGAKNSAGFGMVEPC